MDKLTLVGIITGLLAILLGQMIEGGNLHHLLNLSALCIVMGGTLGAVMIQTPFITFKRAFSIMPWVIKPPQLPFDYYRALLVDLTKKASQMGILSLENHIAIEKNPLVSKGLELFVMGVDAQTIRQVLESEIDREEHHDFRAANVFDSMGGYSPTIGILGAVLGLIQVMRNLGDPSELGAGIATAFVATVYGVGMANLFFLPIASKLKSCIHNKALFEEMLLEGMVAMAGGESPYTIQLKLDNFGHKKKNEKK